MAENKKNTFGDILKKAFDPKKEAVKPVAKATAAAKPAVKTTFVPKPAGATSGSATTEKILAGVKAKEKLDALKAAKDMQIAKLHTKTHQDLINAAYKAAEELKISPFAILKEEWSNFTNTRGNKYTGPAVDDLKHLDDKQKAALKKALGL